MIAATLYGKSPSEEARFRVRSGVEGLDADGLRLLDGLQDCIGHFTYVENSRLSPHSRVQIKGQSFQTVATNLLHPRIEEACRFSRVDCQYSHAASHTVSSAAVHAAVTVLKAGRIEAEQLVQRAFNRIADKSTRSPWRQFLDFGQQQSVSRALDQHIKIRRKIRIIMPSSMLEQGIVHHSIHAAFLAAERVAVVIKSHLHDGIPENVNLFREIAASYPPGSIDVLVRPFNSSEWREGWFG